MKDCEIFIMKSLPQEYSEKTLSSLKSSCGDNNILKSIKIIDELGTREETLNKILSLRNKNKDLFVVADDIVFLDGWYESLNKHYSCGDIIGFSMIDQKKGYLQDFGYDFVNADHGLSYKGLYKHSDPKDFSLPDYRECDAVTGCAMVIKKEVCELITEFPAEGSNRWGELIYSHLAKKKGFKTIVLSSHLKHGAISTKQKNSISKSSMSWLVERELWLDVVKKFLKEVNPEISYKSILLDDLQKYIDQDHGLLIYGCGVNADAILENINHTNWHISSGLPEEIGRVFKGKKIKDIKKVNFNNFSNILITPVGYDADILKYFPDKIVDSIKGVSLIHINDKLQLSLRKIDL